MFTRGTSLKGPAIVTIGSGASAVQFRTKGDITANFNINTFDILSSERGVIDKRRDDISIQLQFEPVGQITEAMIELLWGWLDKPAGTSIFGNTDTPCVITPLTGKEQITLHASAITNMPSAVFSAIQTAVGQVQVEAIIANEKEWNNAAARFNIANVSAPTLAALDPTTIPTHPARVQFGAGAPWVDLATREGVTVNFEMQLSDEKTDADGLVDKTLGAMAASASFSPMGPTLADVLTKMGLQGEGIRRGSSMASSGFEFVVESQYPGGLRLRIPNAAIMSAPATWGLDTPRHGALSLSSLPWSGVVAEVSMVETSGGAGTP